MASAPNDGDHYIIINVASNSCLDLDNGSTRDGTPVQGWGQDFRSDKIQNQIWKTARDGNYFKLFNKASGTALDLDDGGNGNGVKIQGWGSHNVPAQLWQFEKASGPSRGPPLFLSVYMPHGSIKQRSTGPDPIGDKHTDNTNRIRNKASNTVMDLNNGNSRNG